MPTRRQDIEGFVQDVLKQIPQEQHKSPDITLLVFKTIESKRALLGPGYRAIGGGKGSSLHDDIAKAVKSLLGRETDEGKIIPVADDECTLIESYTRFKP
jgi:hypothetical protein